MSGTSAEYNKTPGTVQRRYFDPEGTSTATSADMVHECPFTVNGVSQATGISADPYCVIRQ